MFQVPSYKLNLIYIFISSFMVIYNKIYYILCRSLSVTKFLAAILDFGGHLEIVSYVMKADVQWSINPK